MTGLFWLTAGLFFVLKGADWLVEGAINLARRLNVSDLAIGLTVVAFGTSLPELAVNIFAAIGNQPSVAIGNITGSNICNILLILGITALLRPLPVQPSVVWTEIPFSLLAAILLLVFTHDKLLDGAASNVLSRTDSLNLLAMFLIFLTYIMRTGREILEQEENKEAEQVTLGKAIIFIILGLLLLLSGGKMVVQGAIQIADKLSVSKSFVAVTLVAIGTSIPELATTIVASFKGKVNIAMGNIIGSNIFNVFLILGVSSMIRPSPVPQELNLSIYTGVIAAAVLLVLLLIDKRSTLSRGQGAVILCLYILYLILQPR